MTRARRLTAAVAGALFWSTAGSTLLACPICFRMEQGPTSDGVRAAVVVLMAVTVAVLGCFARFVVRLAQGENLERGTRNEERGTRNVERGTA
jgi:hypothetical protein